MASFFTTADLSLAQASPTSILAHPAPSGEEQKLFRYPSKTGLHSEPATMLIQGFKSAWMRRLFAGMSTISTSASLTLISSKDAEETPAL